MSAHARRSERRPEGEDGRVAEGDNNARQAQSTDGTLNASSGRTDFHPPRSRTPTSSRQAGAAARASSHEMHTSGTSTTMRWPQRSQRYDGEGASIPHIFSPPRTAQSTPRSTNAAIAMEANQNMPLQRGNDNFTVDLESVEFPPDVFNLPVGSFNEDSPPRGHSSDSDERFRRRGSPRASPVARQPPMPLFHDSQRDRLFNSTFTPAQSPPPQTRRSAASQFSYYPENPDWYSPPPIDHPGMYYGDTPRRSPIRLSTPNRGGVEFFQQTPSRPAPYSYESLNLMGTPKGVLGDDLSPVGYDEGLPLSIPDQQMGTKMDFGPLDSEHEPPRGAPPPLQSPLGSFLQEFAPSPMGDIPGPSRSPPSNRRATGPYGRHPYPMPPYQHPSHHSRPPNHPPSSLKASPVVPQGDTRPRRLWTQEPRQGHPTSSTMRVELGSSGKGLEGINQVMRAQTSTPTSHRMHPHHRVPYPYHPHYPHHRSHGPPRMPPPRYQMPHRGTAKSPTPPHAGSSRFPFSTGDKKAPPPAAASTRPSSAQGKSADTKQKAAPKDKENEKQASAAPRQRSPCNCKKSRCLKLYCECFSAERYCDGCNCTDCCNNGDHAELRDKAMKETKSKNPKAFQPRLNLVSDNPAQSNHSMGCRCKKSECLKKYCECFQAGVFCAGKCKCKSCANYAGSQKLIDKRRKMKDVRGAEIAMRAAEEAWKSQSARQPALHPQVPPSATPISSRRPSLPTMLRPSPDPRSSGAQLVPRPHYMGSSYLHQVPKMNFSPMGVPPVTPGYASSVKHPRVLPPAPSTAPVQTIQSAKRTATEITPSVHPRTPAVRLEFDPSSSRKRRKKGNQDEATYPYFGPSVPEQPRTTALAVFSFLSNDDVHKAALVSKTWKSLAEDGELWQFP